MAEESAERAEDLDLMARVQPLAYLHLIPVDWGTDPC